MRGLFRLAIAADASAQVDRWLGTQTGEVGAIARTWLICLRRRGDDVRVVMHDGGPTACVAGAAFAYVGSFSAHVSVGFFHGAALPDPAGLLQGSGKFMRHVKIVPGRSLDRPAIEAL
ncbi:MAG: DUF1801 domain-containing protein, partial [Acidobacteria bacterium]|nr:DUF1801 domain-containing protein [Acidobacteriota bacterium]